MKVKGLDIVVINELQHIFYMTGVALPYVDRNNAFLIIPIESMPVLICPKTDELLVNECCPADVCIRTYANVPYGKGMKITKNPLRLAKGVFGELNLARGRVGLEEKYMPVSTKNVLMNILPKERFEDSSAIIEEMRMTKSDEEIKSIKEACEIIDSVFEITFQDILRTGKSEMQVASSICQELIGAGADGWPFFPVVRSGRRSACVWVSASEKILERGNIVLVDIGAFHRGYCAEYTRMAVMGTPSQGQKKAFEVVLDVTQKTVDMIEPGVEACEIDNFTREEIKRYGYLKYFIGHWTGHGIGLEAFEKPILGFEDSTKIKPRMVLAVEPGVYVNQFGVRLEENLVVTEKGSIIISRFPTELYVVG